MTVRVHWASPIAYLGFKLCNHWVMRSSPTTALDVSPSSYLQEEGGSSVCLSRQVLKIRLVDLTGHLLILRNFLEIGMIIRIVDFMQNKFLYNHSYFVRWSTLQYQVPENDHQVGFRVWSLESLLVTILQSFWCSCHWVLWGIKPVQEAHWQKDRTAPSVLILGNSFIIFQNRLMTQINIILILLLWLEMVYTKGCTADSDIFIIG